MIQIILFFSVMFISGLASAQDVWHSNEIYSVTKEACTMIKEKDLTSVSRTTIKAGFSPSKNFNRLLFWLYRESFYSALSEFTYLSKTPFVTYILDDQGFKTALRECYSGRKEMEEVFISSISASDRNGKIIAAATQILIGWGSWLLVARLGAIGAIRVVGWLKAFSIGGGIVLIGQALTNWAQKNRYIRSLCGELKGEELSACLKKRYQNSLQNLEASLESRKEVNSSMLSLTQQVLNAQKSIADLKVRLTKNTDRTERLKIEADIARQQAFLDLVLKGIPS